MLARRADLFRLGHGRYAIAEKVKSGRLSVPRRGWLAGSGAPPSAERAVTLGGKLGGGSALATFGVWVDDATNLVVSSAPTASRLPPLVGGERRVWIPERFAEASDVSWRVSVQDAIIQHALFASRTELIATIDSALHQRLILDCQVDELLRLLPANKRPRRAELDGGSMSGTESRMRVALRRCGYRVQTQVTIRGVGTVDMVVDGWLIVECDSKKHHDDLAQQRKDRQRDGDASLADYSSVRFTYEQVMYEMDWCLAVVARELRRGRPARSVVAQRNAG